MLESIPGYQVIGEAGDGLEGVQKAAQLHPEIVLLDIGMPLLNGIDAAPRIRRASPQSKIVFVTQENDYDLKNAALRAGAEAYLLKSKVGSELIPAMDTLGTKPGATSGGLYSRNSEDACELAYD
jgi:DNA-binding NarL/FixJ family response regulator